MSISAMVGRGVVSFRRRGEILTAKRNAPGCGSAGGCGLVEDNHFTSIMTATDTLNLFSPPETNDTAELAAGRSASAFPWSAPVARALSHAAVRQIAELLPDDAMQLIVREAYLFRAGEIILQARSQAK